MSAPSAYRLEMVMSIAQATVQRLIADNPTIATDEDALLAALAAEDIEAEHLIARLIRAHIEADAMAETADKRVADIRTRRDRFRRQADAYRGAAFAAMDALGLTRLKEPDFTASISTGRRAVVITDPDALDDRYVRVKREPDKTAIGAALAAGPVAGAELGNSMPVITIRKG